MIWKILKTHLPALKKQTSVDGSEPHDGVTCLEVSQSAAFIMQEETEALEQFRRRCLDYSFSRSWWQGFLHQFLACRIVRRVIVVRGRRLRLGWIKWRIQGRTDNWNLYPEGLKKRG